jgi:hypothetical protein
MVFFLLEFFSYGNFLDMINTILLLLFIIITQSDLQDAQSLLQWNVIDVKYQCNSPGCSPSTIVSVSTLADCKMTCLNTVGCRTVNFDSKLNQCGLYSDIPSQNCKPLPQTGILPISIIDGKQLFTIK